MSESVFVRDADFTAVEKEIRNLLAATDRGEFDTELKKAGVTRNPNVKLTEGVKIEEGQGLSPDQWITIITVFGPLAATIAKDVWQVVILPRLKRVFRPDSVSPTDPRQ